MDTKDLLNPTANLADFDTEAGLESPLLGDDLGNVQDVNNSDNVFTTEPFVDPEEALRLEFEQAQKAVTASAENRATTPFQVAAMTHARMCNPALAEIDRISGGAAKRILKYLIAYPFYVKELNAQDKQVEAIAEVCDKLVQTKFTMAMCQAIEKEARTAKAVEEQEALIQDVPDDVPEFEAKK